MPAPLDTLTGNWNGTSTLHRSWLEADEALHSAPSTLSVQATSTFATVNYSWHLDGEEEHGVLVVTADETAAHAAWTDTWHSANVLMPLQGSTGADSVLRLAGTYAAGDGPDWGWRIEFEAVGGGLQFRMVNIDPEGTEEWAVQAEYMRA